jgi:hypothetical protein
MKITFEIENIVMVRGGEGNPALSSVHFIHKTGRKNYVDKD